MHENRHRPTIWWIENYCYDLWSFYFLFKTKNHFSIFVSCSFVSWIHWNRVHLVFDLSKKSFIMFQLIHKFISFFNHIISISIIIERNNNTKIQVTKYLNVIFYISLWTFSPHWIHSLTLNWRINFFSPPSMDIFASCFLNQSSWSFCRSMPFDLRTSIQRWHCCSVDERRKKWWLMMWGLLLASFDLHFS